MDCERRKEGEAGIDVVYMAEHVVRQSTNLCLVRYVGVRYYKVVARTVSAYSSHHPPRQTRLTALAELPHRHPPTASYPSDNTPSPPSIPPSPPTQSNPNPAQTHTPPSLPPN